MTNASAKVETSTFNRSGKKAWQKPQVDLIAMTEDFDPSSGNSREQWKAALELRGVAAQLRGPQAQ